MLNPTAPNCFANYLTLHVPLLQVYKLLDAAFDRYLSFCDTYEAAEKTIQPLVSSALEPWVPNFIAGPGTIATAKLGSASNAATEAASAFVEVKAQLAAKQGELGETKAQLAAKEGKLVETKAQLAAKEGELVKTKAQLAAQERKLVDTKAQLAAKERELQDVREQLAVQYINIMELEEDCKPSAVLASARGACKGVIATDAGAIIHKSTMPESMQEMAVDSVIQALAQRPASYYKTARYIRDSMTDKQGSQRWSCAVGPKKQYGTDFNYTAGTYVVFHMGTLRIELWQASAR